MVTAILVEKSGEKFIFHATRNSWATDVDGLKDKQDLRNFLERVLEMIGDLGFTDEDSYDVVPLHFSIIADHRQRIEAYTRDLTTKLAQCKKIAQPFPADLHEDFGLSSLEQALRTASQEPDDRRRHRQILMSCANYLDKHRSHVAALTKAGSDPEPWNQLFHFAGRLRSYIKNLWYFWKAKEQFPELFQNFEVNIVDPAKVVPVPCTWSLDQVRKEFKSKGKNMWDEKDIDKVHKKIEKLSAERSGCFNRVVHAEVHLANWFFNERLGGVEPPQSQAKARLFRGWRYVASSKPCCRFCYDFFALCSPLFLCRKAHFKIYARWTLPEFSLCRSEEAKKQLEIAYEEMDHRVIDQIRVKLGKLKPESAWRRNCSEDDLSDLERQEEKPGRHRRKPVK
ncbi:hypothetical protein K456DRAFT_41858 [Colletotrichum gloeosporioides 23]|nr:hypothetical protein K456DRAFT_41858 [Colletotrichum gloeosporioides 23]